MPHRFEIKAGDDLLMLEAIGASIQALPPHEPVEIRLARKLGSQFFKESRIASLLGSVARAGRHLTVSDWYNEWREADISSYFQHSLPGMAAATYAGRICNLTGAELPTPQRTLRQEVALAGGILEPKEHGGRGNSITFCSFDGESGESLVFATAIGNPSELKRLFHLYRKRYLETGTGESFSEQTRKADDALTNFIYEVYQNSFEHGRLDGGNAELFGLRFFRLRKHIDFRKESFLNHAEGFPALRDYLELRTPNAGSFKYYEISISDHGMGLVDRFLATRPDYAATASTMARVDLLNSLLTSPLTSNKDIPGAGYGLPRALAAVEKLEGFLSLRTDCYWQYGSYTGREMGLDKVGLRAVETTEQLSKVAGTHINILLPLRKG